MCRQRLLRALVAVFVALLVMTLEPTPSSAAPELTDLTDPGDGQTVASSPNQLSLVFTEDLTQAPGIVIQSSDRQPITGVGEIARGDDAMTWYVPLTVQLPPDTYKVTWSADGAAGVYQFTVGTGAGDVATTTATAAPAANDTASATGDATSTTAAATDSTAVRTTAGDESAGAHRVRVIVRFLAYLALAALAGGLLAIALIWPEGVEYVLTGRYLRLVWLAAVAAALLDVVVTRAVVADASLGSSISPASWGDLADGLAGLAVVIRFVLVLATAWSVFGPERVVDEATQIPSLLAPLLAVGTFGFTRASDGFDLLVTPATFVHVIAFAAWFGGLALLWRVTLAGSGEKDLVDAVRNFRKISNPALVAIAVTGLLLLVKLVGGFGNLFSTGYGRLALLKAIVSAVVIYVALVNRTTAAARLGRLGLMPARLAFRLRRAIGTELTIGALVLVLTAWMVGSHPPGLDASAAQRSKPTLIVGPMTNSAGLDLEVGFAPALSGLNTVTITVDKPATGLVTLVVQFDPIDQYVESIVIEAPTTLTGRGELVVEDVPFNAPGRWKVTVTGTGTDGSLGTLESEFTLAPGTTVTTADQSTVPATPSTVTSVVDDAGG